VSVQGFANGAEIVLTGDGATLDKYGPVEGIHRDTSARPRGCAGDQFDSNRGKRRKGCAVDGRGTPTVRRADGERSAAAWRCGLRIRHRRRDPRSLGLSCIEQIERSGSASAWRGVQRGQSPCMSPSCRAHRREDTDDGIRAGVSACSGAPISCSRRRHAGRLPWDDCKWDTMPARSVSEKGGTLLVGRLRRRYFLRFLRGAPRAPRLLGVRQALLGRTPSRYWRPLIVRRSQSMTA
jgi:hypothetical protein